MATPLEDATMTLRNMVGRVFDDEHLPLTAANERAMHDAVDSVIAAALAAAAPGGHPSESYVIEYRDLEGERTTISTDPFPGALDDHSGIERWRQMAQIVVKHGGYDVKLHVTTSYHRVEEFGGDPPADPGAVLDTRAPYEGPRGS